MTAEDRLRPRDVTNQLNEWHYRVRPAHSGGGYVAWAATTPDLGEAPTDVAPGHVVWSLYDDREEEALHRLKLAITGEAHEVELRAARRRHSAIEHPR
jgi:hypothetical protein